MDHGTSRQDSRVVSTIANPHGGLATGTSGDGPASGLGDMAVPRRSAPAESYPVTTPGYDEIPSVTGMRRSPMDCSKLVARIILVLCAASMAPVAALAHHSRAHYGDEIVELDAEIVAIDWRNPHVTFTIRAPSASGEETTWELEGGSTYMLGRYSGLGRELFNVGDQVRVAGPISTVRPNEMLAAYNRDEDDPALRCVKLGMPSTMSNPHPMHFVDGGDRITVNIQENDVVRTIYLGENAAAAAQPPSPLGYSVGRWEGTTLVVRTTNINWPYFDRTGIPLSEDVAVDERFEISETGSHMVIRVVTTDPVNFEAPVTTQRFYALLGEGVKSYDCVAR